MTTFRFGGHVLHHADMRAALARIEDNSIDACVSDPPYHLTSVVKRFGKEGSAPAKFGSDGAFGRQSKGFMGKSWDGGDISFDPETWAEVLRVLKPGGHIVAFAGTRTYHRIACAIEDAGFEIRDQLAWAYGVGLPKSHDVSKGIDKLDAVDIRRDRNLSFTSWIRSTGLSSATLDSLTSSNMGGHYTTKASQPAVATRAHFEMIRPEIRIVVPAWIEALIDEREVESENYKSREITAVRTDGVGNTEASLHKQEGFAASRDTVFAATAPATDAARQWEGWGTALKPAWEPICLARKPLSERTVAANVLRWGTGAINVDGCRVEGGEILPGGTRRSGGIMGASEPLGGWTPTHTARFPANVCHDGSDEVLAAFPESKGQQGDLKSSNPRPTKTCFGDMAAPLPHRARKDTGSAARFFYSAKASKADRALSRHPTVKPVKLMQWLCRMVTPPGGTVLDPFAGSGTTGAAAHLEGFRSVLIERESEYVADILRRAKSMGEAMPADEVDDYELPEMRLAA
jgi:DNA modification methylase